MFTWTRQKRGALTVNHMAPTSVCVYCIRSKSTLNRVSVVAIPCHASRPPFSLTHSPFQKKSTDYPCYSKKRTERQALLDNLKAKPCADCGNSYPTCVMDFDHLPGSVKRFSPSKAVMTVALSRILSELEQCEVVCANCHRIRTWSRHHARATAG